MTNSTGKFSAENPDIVNGGFDSGHGSSLDRIYGRGERVNSANGSSSHQYYYNVIPAPRHSHHHREPSGLDLTHRADQRGSAFELYKKPSDPRNIHYLEHSLR